MNKPVGYIVGIALVIGVGAILQYFLCCGPGMASDKLNESGLLSNEGMPFRMDDPEGHFTVDTDHNFDFPVSSYAFLTPISSDIENGIDQLQTFLNSNENVTLEILGYAYPGEDNLSAFPTLGEARANAVKSAFIDRGVAGSQMTVAGTTFDGTLPSQDSVVRGPVSYALSRPGEGIVSGSELGNDSENKVEDLSGFVAGLQSQPLVLHFDVGSAYVNLTTSERQLISKLNKYIDQNIEARIEITGHTDNTGSPMENEKLGMERARFLKSYLIQNGFQENRINTVSQGQSEPIATNNTEAGKAENRRAVLTIKN